MKEEKEYSGIWKNIGCILSAVAIIALVVFLGILAYQLFSGA
ncbi:Hypothetical protein I595_208 [Croceitalea dokdonensis DOKDO 023]|uniref:Uncharacterized protein n=1 Tax=Croceitalea dokdonensis DOKDO 023 TaxID=1300341 RepID=A0A0P7AYQ8_9FLAO|nr:hypothetical protein [Croceitalea dokdonensis]KPM33305.1 Hypothetical protein I595_208 [Croceitalea dokdonensis DOKDO 023]